MNGIGAEGGKALLCPGCLWPFASCIPFPCEALAEALKVNQAVTDISLAFNRIGAEGGKALALPKNQEVFAAYNPGPAFLHQALADALKTNTAITSIDLENNEIAHEGCEALLYGSYRCKPLLLSCSGPRRCSEDQHLYQTHQPRGE